jgi:hypothetical protein
MKAAMLVLCIIIDDIGIAPGEFVEESQPGYVFWLMHKDFHVYFLTSWLNYPKAELKSQKGIMTRL